MNDDSPISERRRAPDTRSVTLGPRDVNDAVRILKRLLFDPNELADEDDAQPFVLLEPPIPAQPHVDRDDLIKRARRELENRAWREKHFRRDMFGEPAWDILLILYVEDRRFTIAGLTAASRAKPTTALRWIDYLTAEQLIVREFHPFDARSILLALSGKGRQALDLYFSRAAPNAE